MSDQLMTVARFTDPIEASLARNRLEDAGVQAMLNNEEAGVIGWQLTNNGTIELLVHEEDFEAAREALRYRDLSVREAMDRSADAHPEGIVESGVPSSDNTAITTPEAPEEEEPPTDPLVEKIDRAFRAALLGVFFFPIEFYACYLLFVILTDERPIPPSRQSKVWGAFLICVPMTLLILFVLRWIFFFLWPEFPG